MFGKNGKNWIKYIDIHTHSKNTNHFALYNVLANEIPNDITEIPNFSIGLHPWYVTEDFKKYISELEHYIRMENCLAIGEIGLDRVQKGNWDLQLQAFAQQIKLAQKYRKPVIIHAVKSYSDILEFRKKSDLSLAWIIHEFSGNQFQANSLLEKNCYLSFGHFLLNSSKLQQFFRLVDLSKVFFETDESTISVEKIYLKAAVLKNISMETLIEQIQFNFNEVF